jgi:hypothetical protein
MAVRIDASKFKIVVDDSKAKPGSDKGPKRVFGHLTEGWSGSNWTGDALTATGSVPVTLGPTDMFDLGFVQLARGVTWQGFYAGRTAKEGSIILDYFLPPAMTSTLLLDGGSQNITDPWYRAQRTITRSGTAQAQWGDHPGLSAPRQFENREVSNVPNFLFHAILDREFATILTAIVGAGTPQYLGFFEWKLRYELKMKWENGEPKVRRNFSTFAITTQPTAGRPTAAHWQALLNSPTGERANAVAARAELQTNNLGPPNRLDLKTRFSNLESDFWT